MSAKEQIFSCYRNKKKTLVFGTQTLADAWTRFYVSENPGQSVFSDSAVSWDSFCDMLTDHDGLECADNTDRLSFSYSILCDEDIFRRLNYFSNPLFPESRHAFAGNIAKLLPSFCRIGELKGKDGVSASMISDAELIAGEYVKYLSENGLYERSYLRKHTERATADYVIVFPQLCSDPDLLLILNNSSCSVINLPDDNGDFSFFLYDNSFSEIRDTVRRIAFLLYEKHVSPSDIAITCSSSDTYRPYLEREALCRGIKLAFTSRSQYSLYPQGRFFILLYRMYSENFSFESVRSFLLEPSFPFISRETCILVISLGVKYKVSGVGANSWLSALGYASVKCASERKKEYDDAFEFFKALVSFTRRICTVSDPIVSISLFEAFRDRYIDTTSSFGHNDSMLGSCLDIFSRIARRKASYSESVFRVFLDILSSSTYVEKVSDGIRVYNYPVSAAMPVKYHFVTGLDEKTSSVPVNRYPFVNDINSLPDSVTGAVIMAYLNPSFSTESRLCGSAVGFDGARTVPACLSGYEKRQNEVMRDSLAEEYSVWSGGITESRPYPAQRISFRNAEESILRADYKGFSFPDLMGRRMNISASSFRSFSECPYRGFAEFALGLSELQREPIDPDPVVLGTIIHNVLEKVLISERIADIKPQTVKSVLDEEIKHSLECHRLGNRISAVHIQKKYGPRLASLSEAAIISGIPESAELVCNEKRLPPYPVPGLENVSINGVADTILRDGESYYLIDYKTNGDSDYGSSPEEISPQIPVYSRILNQSEHIDIVWAAYYSVAKEKMLLVWPVRTSGHRETGFKKCDVLAALDNRLMALKLAFEGSYFSCTDDSDVCSRCPFGGLCRRRFSAR